jgi:hypothetical protein
MRIGASALARHGGAAALLLLVAWAASEQRRRAHPQEPVNAAVRRAASIDYEVAAAEWPGADDPTYCAIVRRFGLPPEHVAATLQLNGGPRGCVDGNAPVARGQTILIAIEPAQDNACRPDVYTCS